MTKSDSARGRATGRRRDLASRQLPLRWQTNASRLQVPATDSSMRRPRNLLTRVVRYRYWPDHLLGEILVQALDRNRDPGDRPADHRAFALSRAIAGFLSPAASPIPARQAGEIGFVVLGMALVMIVGGIDLSVGSMFALTRLLRAVSASTFWTGRSPAVVVATLACGAVLGAVNGVLIGYLRLRAFITTLITLIIYRSAYDSADSATIRHAIAAGFPDFPTLGLHRRRRCAGRAERRSRLCWSSRSSATSS